MPNRKLSPASKFAEDENVHKFYQRIGRKGALTLQARIASGEIALDDVKAPDVPDDEEPVAAESQDPVQEEIDEAATPARPAARRTR